LGAELTGSVPRRAGRRLLVARPALLASTLLPGTALLPVILLAEALLALLAVSVLA
jgi:hypothetical protein